MFICIVLSVSSAQTAGLCSFWFLFHHPSFLHTKLMKKHESFWTMVLGCEEIKLVNPKGNLSWMFIGRTDAEAETPIFWPPDVKNWLIGQDPDAGKDWRWEEKGTTEAEMVGWHHWLRGHEFEQALGVGWSKKEVIGKSACFPDGASDKRARLPVQKS